VSPNLLTMFIFKVYKKNKKSDKIYKYFRLMRSYRIVNKIRHDQKDSAILSHIFVGILAYQVVNII